FLPWKAVISEAETARGKRRLFIRSSPSNVTLARVMLKGLTKAYDGALAVDQLNLEVKDKEFVVLLGPSGCGKTTTLRCVAGLEFPDEGEIYIGDRLVHDLDAKLPVHIRAELTRLQKALALTTIYMTHHQHKAMTMADRVAQLSKGVLQQYDAPQTLSHRPTNQFAAGFVGSPPINLVDCNL